MKRYNDIDDQGLLKLIVKDDAAAFGMLYDKYWQKLFAIAYNRLKDMQTAEDVVHDVFTSLWANRKNTEIVAVENYLATATKYIILNIIKKKERERIYTRENYSNAIDMQIENAVHYKRILEIVKTEIEKLPEKCKLIFKYSREHQMPARQISAELNISSKTVENQINKALKQLKLVSKTMSILLHLLF